MSEVHKKQKANGQQLRKHKCPHCKYYFPAAVILCVAHCFISYVSNVFGLSRNVCFPSNHKLMTQVKCSLVSGTVRLLKLKWSSLKDKFLF
jgi:hypothetical protein